MTRRLDWEARFSAFVVARRDMAFAWGSNDCCLFAADCVRALTGNDPARALRGYATALEAARLVESRGGMHQLATSAMGAALAPAMAAVGDVVLLVNDGRELLGVCNGVNALAPGELGIAVLGMDAAVAAWRV